MHGRIDKRPVRKLDGKRIAWIIAICVSVSMFFAGYYLGDMNGIVITYHNETRSFGTINFVPYAPVNRSFSNASAASVVVPAVDEEGNGITTVLTVQILPGDGRVLTNIDKLLFWVDTQNSIRTSSKVASNITGVNLSRYDIIYTVVSNATSVEGPSAGAALAVATIAAIQNKKVNPEVMISGSINHDGTIGPVGEILLKAKTAREVGAKLLLVPVNQSHEITYETRKFCEDLDAPNACMSETVPTNVNVSAEAGIDVIEVNNISEALKYFFDYD
jgi:uncharacterized protein